ncbi:MAG: hypothetical protein IPK29_08855 [Betaproteobacteria bacterium]|nr:hypothetical protein [Betaproteobacteria bacterium]
MRVVLKLAALPLALLALASSGAAQAQAAYPNKPIRFMVGFRPAAAPTWPAAPFRSASRSAWVSR